GGGADVGVRGSAEGAAHALGISRRAPDEALVAGRAAVQEAAPLGRAVARLAVGRGRRRRGDGGADPRALVGAEVAAAPGGAVLVDRIAGRHAQPRRAV